MHSELENFEKSLNLGDVDSIIFSRDKRPKAPTDKPAPVGNLCTVVIWSLIFGIGAIAFGSLFQIATGAIATHNLDRKTAAKAAQVAQLKEAQILISEISGDICILPDGK